MEYILIYLVLVVLVSVWAARWGREPVLYFVLSVLLSPLLGGLILLIHGEDRAGAEQQRMVTAGQKKCPFCAELIKKEAAVCRYCGRDLPEAETPAKKEPPASIATARPNLPPEVEPAQEHKGPLGVSPFLWAVLVLLVAVRLLMLASP